MWVAISLALLAGPLELTAQNPAETAKTARGKSRSDWAFQPIANPAFTRHCSICSAWTNRSSLSTTPAVSNN
jgi:hypothetical protein